jgi:Tfp pilus assembly PilM family ATPase
VANALVECRAEGLGDVRNIALVGNGSRLSELAALIERATAVRVRPGTLDPTVSQALPPDVLRAAAPDWCLAYGLALWSAP